MALTYAFTAIFRRAYRRGMAFILLLPCSGWAVVTEADLTDITIAQFKLGLERTEVEALLQQHFPNTKKSDLTTVAGFHCIKNQCQAQRNDAQGNTALSLHFNRRNQVYWITLNSQFKLAGNAEECLRLASEQLLAMRQQYSPDDQRFFYGPNTVILRLNKPGHPDPADNSLFGFRAQIKCDPLAKGLAYSEFELRDNKL